MTGKVLNKATLAGDWRSDGIILVMDDGETRLSTWLDPLEVEAMILYLCQSPWRAEVMPKEKVTCH